VDWFKTNPSTGFVPNKAEYVLSQDGYPFLFIRAKETDIVNYLPNPYPKIYPKYNILLVYNTSIKKKPSGMAVVHRNIGTGNDTTNTYTALA
jgi:hypothetical protein